MSQGLVYVASSWRNPFYDDVIMALREAGIPHYNFRHPGPGVPGFQWTEIDPQWQTWTPEAYRAALLHPIAAEGFRRDMEALRACDRLLLVMPCGRSAHTELGYAIGAGKETLIYLPPAAAFEPELMYKMATHLCASLEEVLARLRDGA